MRKRQNSETSDILRAFLSLVVAKLSDLKNSPVSWPTLDIDDMFVVCVATCIICSGHRRMQNPTWIVRCRKHRRLVQYRRRHCRRRHRQERSGWLCRENCPCTFDGTLRTVQKLWLPINNILVRHYHRLDVIRQVCFWNSLTQQQNPTCWH